MCEFWWGGWELMVFGGNFMGFGKDLERFWRICSFSTIIDHYYRMSEKNMVFYLSPVQTLAWFCPKIGPSSLDVLSEWPQSRDEFYSMKLFLQNRIYHSLLQFFFEKFSIESAFLKKITRNLHKYSKEVAAKKYASEKNQNSKNH